MLIQTSVYITILLVATCTCTLNRNVSDLVIVHDSIEGLNPHRVNVTIKNNPLGVVPSQIGHVSHDVGKQT